jgi:phosphoglycolate phosphatase
MSVVNFILDLDGTLVDSFQDIYAALDALAKDAGLDTPSKSEVRDQLHLRLDQLVGVMFPNADVSMLMDGFRKHYDKTGYSNTVPYPGVPGTLESMHRNGCRLFVATNKRTVAAKALVKRLDTESRIEKVWASDCATPPLAKSDLVKRLIEEHQLDRNLTVFVGDSKDDLDAARQNEISFIFASYGYGKLDQKDYLDLRVQTISTFPELMNFCDIQR